MLHEWRERVMLRLAKRFTTWGMIALQQLAPKVAALPVEERRKRFFLMLLLLILTPTLIFFIWIDLQDVGLTIAVILEMIALVLNIRPYSDLISYSCNYRLVNSVLPVVEIKSV